MEQKDFLIHPEVDNLIRNLLVAEKIDEPIITIQGGSSKGDNYFGVIKRISVKGKTYGKDFELHWILKTAPQLSSFREYTRIDKVYEREIYVYRELFPLFLKFQTEKCVEEPFESYPPFIGSSLTPYQELVVMEDVKRKGFVLKNRMETFDFDHAKSVMRTYGKLHAVSYAIKDQMSDLFETVRKNTEESFVSGISEKLLMKQEEMFCSRNMAVLDPIKHSLHRDVFDKYRKRSLEIIKDTFKTSYEDPYSVVCHGDSWVNNILFKYNDKSNSEKPSEVCLLDFQLTRYGSPAFDLSYFLFTCTEKTLRDNHYNELLAIYYQSLCTHITNLGSCPEKMLPFEVLQQQLRRYSIVGYFFTQIVLHLMISEAEETPDFTKEMNSNELLDAIGHQSKNETIYERRIRGVLEDFVERGYFDFINEKYKN